MNTIEVMGTNVRENLTSICAFLIKAVRDGDKEVSLYSTLFFVKGNFDKLKGEMKSQLAGLCRMKSTRPKIFCGFKMYGLEIHFLRGDDDKELLVSRILSLFNGFGPSDDLCLENKKG